MLLTDVHFEFGISNITLEKYILWVTKFKPQGLY